jgi:hypothetical protein
LYLGVAAASLLNSARPSTEGFTVFLQRASFYAPEVSRMNLVTANDELAEIENKIRSLVESNLISGQPYLLSKLGKDLGADLYALKRLTEKTLAPFLKDRFSAEYSIVGTGAHSNVQALVRGSGRVHDAANVNIEQTRSTKNAPRYNYRFWAAFSVPLSRGRRFLNLRDFTFQDSTQEPLSGEYREVEQAFIVQEDAENRDTHIQENIQRWLSEKGLLPEHFFAKPRPSTEKIAHGVRGRSILEAVIEALDRRQLANTSMSLDVIAELLRRNI